MHSSSSDITSKSESNIIKAPSDRAFTYKAEKISCVFLKHKIKIRDIQTLDNMNSSIPQVDYLEQLPTKKIPVLDHGSVEIIDIMPRIGPVDRTPEFRVVEAARTSMNGGIKSPAIDERLLRYLYNNHHTSPFEMVKISFTLVIPEVFATHILRHRSLKFSNVNAYSLRYSEALEEVYTPTDIEEILNFYSPDKVDGGIRVPDENNKQLSRVGESEKIGQIKEIMERANKLRDQQYQLYQEMLKLGVPGETARLWLPNSKYTRLFLTMDLHNFLNFCFLRADFEHSQWETAKYAEAMIQLVRPLFPVTLSAFENKVQGISLSVDELQAIQGGKVDSLPKREREQLQRKLKSLQAKDPSKDA